MTARRQFNHSAADENRRTRLHVITELDRLMAVQLDPAFTGNVEVLVPAKGGKLGLPHFTVKRFGAAPELSDETL